MYQYAKDAEKNNIAVIIAGAGGSAHLPGMISALTSIPVLGVPIESKKLKGLESLAKKENLDLNKLTVLTSNFFAATASIYNWNK